VLALEDLPPLTTGTTVALVGLMLCLWLFLRVRILRRRLADRESQAPQAVGAAWLQGVAQARATMPILALAATALALLLAYGLRP
jgi:hypothetical protein